MASTGTAQFTLNRDDLIAASLRVLRVLQSGETPNADDIAIGAESVNILLKNWQAYGLILTCYQQIAIPCVASQTVYTMGESGADVTIPRPLRLFDGAFIRKTISGVVTDTPLEILSRQGYLQEATKAVTGTTSKVYYEPSIYIAPAAGLYQTSPSVGWGKLYLYYPSVDNTYTIYGNFQRPVYDMSAAGNEFDLPQEWFLALKFGLAAQMADDFEVPESRCMRLLQTAQMYRMELEAWQKIQGDTNFAEARQQQEKVQLQEKPR